MDDATTMPKITILRKFAKDIPNDDNIFESVNFFCCEPDVSPLNRKGVYDTWDIIVNDLRKRYGAPKYLGAWWITSISSHIIMREDIFLIWELSN